MGDGARHSRVLEATKEIFVPITGGSGGAYSQIGGYTGYLINGNGQYAYATLYIPWDFGGIEPLKQATVSFIAQATLTPMNFRVVTDWGKPGYMYASHNQLVSYDINTLLNLVQEKDIGSALAGLGDNAPLEAGDYLGVQISRQVGQNTNAIFLGVRIRYNTPLYAHAP